MCSRACRNVATSKLLGGDGTWEVGGKHGPARKRGKDWRHAKVFALERDGYACQQCEATEDLEVHHWEPYFVSFDNHPDNLVTLCRGCHQAKHEEYRREGSLMQTFTVEIGGTEITIYRDSDGKFIIPDDWRGWVGS